MSGNYTPDFVYRDRDFKDWLTEHDHAEKTRRDLAGDAMIFGYDWAKDNENPKGVILGFGVFIGFAFTAIAWMFCGVMKL